MSLPTHGWTTASSPPISPPPSPYSNPSSAMKSWNKTDVDVSLGNSVLQELWKDRGNADFEIRCGKHTFKVHKPVLRAHSKVLTQACDNRSFKEALSGVLKLKNQPYNGKLDSLGDGDDPEMVEEMVYFFYHLDLKEPFDAGTIAWTDWTNNPLPSHKLLRLARIYVLAEKYFIEGLKSRVRTLFKYTLESLLPTPGFCDLEDLIQSVHIVFKKTIEAGGEHGLKTVVATCLAEKMSSIMQQSFIETLLQEIPELAIRVLKETSKLPTCKGCSNRFPDDYLSGWT